jgi:hypothetical protein
MTATAQDARTVAFALRTSDTAWIKRNNGVTGEDGKTFVQVPANEIDAIKFGPADVLRHVFADVPSDAGNAATMCPAKWVPDTAAQFTFAREARVSPQVAEFMRSHGARQAR